MNFSKTNMDPYAEAIEAHAAATTQRAVTPDVWSGDPDVARAARHIAIEQAPSDATSVDVHLGREAMVSLPASWTEGYKGPQTPPKTETHNSRPFFG